MRAGHFNQLGFRLCMSLPVSLVANFWESLSESLLSLVRETFALAR